LHQISKISAFDHGSNFGVWSVSFVDFVFVSGTLRAISSPKRAFNWSCVMYTRRATQRTSPHVRAGDQ
jgi:acyl dehydratase